MKDFSGKNVNLAQHGHFKNLELGICGLVILQCSLFPGQSYY